jgi:hypothetical protein
VSKEIAVAVFDYSKVDKDDKGKLIRLAGQINQFGDKLLSVGNEMGDAIVQAHRLLAGPVGKHTGEGKAQFDKWIEAETTIGLTTAYNCLSVAKRSASFPIIGKLQPTVAYLLAATAVPDEAIEVVESLAGKGEKITVKKAKEVIKRFKRATTGKGGGGRTSTKKNRAAEKPAEPAPVAGPCPHGGEHTYDEEACTRCHDPKPVADTEELEKPVGKKFSKLLELMGQAIRLADEINRDAPHKLHADIFSSLDCANQDIHKWRKAVK